MPPSQNTRRRREGLAGALFWTACSPRGLIAGEHYIRRGLCFRLIGGVFPREDLATEMDGGCRIKPSRKSCCALAEMAARAAGRDDLGMDALRVTDAMGDFGTHP